MADLYSVLPGLQPNQQDILEAELLAKQILEANFVDLDLREGTGVRDLVLRPSAFMLALCKKGYDMYFSQNTLAGVDDTTSTEVVDGLMSNLFLTRNTGTYAVINARLFFARQKTVSVTTTTSFSPEGALLYYPAAATTFPAEALSYDSFENEWYVDIDLIAAVKGVEYNLSSGSLLYFTTFDPYFLHAEINYLAQESAAGESNSEFISRAKTSISTRNLINRPSIDNKLRAEFNYLSRIFLVGAGEEEMYRDQVKVRDFLNPGRIATSWSLISSNTVASIVLPDHGFFVGKKINIENGAGGTPLKFFEVPVSAVTSSSIFQVIVPYTIPVGTSLTLTSPYVVESTEDTYIHRGGCMDIYCGDRVSTKVEQFTIDAAGKITLRGPIINITRSEVSGGSEEDTLPVGVSWEETRADLLNQQVSITQQPSGDLLVVHDMPVVVAGQQIRLENWPTSGNIIHCFVKSIETDNSFLCSFPLPLLTPALGISPILSYIKPSEDIGFSPRQSMVLQFPTTHVGKTVSFEMDYFQDLESVQEMLELSENRVLCADPLVRGYDLFLLTFDIKVYTGVTVTSGEASDLVSSYLKSLAPGEDFILADLVSHLNKAGLTKLQTPVGVTYKHYSRDRLKINQGTILDIKSPPNGTTVFLLEDLQINVVEVPE